MMMRTVPRASTTGVGRCLSPWNFQLEHSALTAVEAYCFGWFRLDILLWLALLGHFALVGTVGALCFGWFRLDNLLWLVLLGHFALVGSVWAFCLGVG